MLPAEQPELLFPVVVVVVVSPFPSVPDAAVVVELTVEVDSGQSQVESS